jgi:hypothetical protein
MNHRSLVSAEIVYQSWFHHELRKNPDIINHRERFINHELPCRARWPQNWYRHTLDPTYALDLLVGEDWDGWTEWSRPEGTYFRVAQNIIAGDGKISPDVATKVKELVIDLSSTPGTLFEDDPMILSGRLLSGPFTVIEGHHRASAVSIAAIQKCVLNPFVVFVGIVR